MPKPLGIPAVVLFSIHEGEIFSLAHVVIVL